MLAAFLVLSSLADRWDEEEENEVLPFSEAVKLEPGRRGAFLPGVLRSYAIQDHPLYADAFEVGQRSFFLVLRTPWHRAQERLFVAAAFEERSDGAARHATRGSRGGRRRGSGRRG